MAARLNALGRHLALAGFMGAGKSTVGAEVARRTGRRFVDLDAEVEQRAGMSIPDLFDQGESEFRQVEAQTAADVLLAAEPTVVALGGGTVLDPSTRDILGERAFTVLLDVDPHDAWARVQDEVRPLARDEEAFHRLYAERRETYDLVSNACVRDVDGVVLAAAGVHVQVGSLQVLGDHVPGEGAVEIVADSNVAGIHGVTAQLALGARDVATHEVPAGEAAKSVSALDKLWRALGIGRDGVLVALGGGCTTDVAGFAAATYMRGVDWVAVPTTLVGQVDAAIGGKTAIDLPAGKNLVGAFHWPAAVLVDPGVLETLPAAQIRNGLAEVVKTGLLAGEPLWELQRHEQVRRCAAFKAGICLADPHDRGSRMQLNLGHTFAHALEAAAGYDLAHGEAVALGLLAALRLSENEAGVETVERVLAPQPVGVDRDVAWAALARDKKSTGGAPRLVLLEPGGTASWGVEVEQAKVRAALDALIVG